MIINTLRLITKWMIRNKTKYIICWVNFAIVSVFFSIILSYNSSTRNPSEANRLIKKVFTVDGGSFAYGSGNKVRIDERDRDFFKDVMKQLGSNKVRMLSELYPEQVCINGKEIVDRCRCRGYLENESFILDAEKEFIKDVSNGNEKGIWVTEDFIGRIGLSHDDIVGGTVSLSIRELDGVEVKGKVNGVIPADLDSSIAYGDIFIPISDNDETSFYIDVIDYELGSEDDYDRNVQIFLDNGIRPGQRNEAIDYNEEIGEGFLNKVMVVSVVLFGFVAVGMINIMVESIASNKEFYRLMFMCGCKRGYLLTFSVLLTLIQGIVGTVFGIIVMLLLSPAVDSFYQYMLSGFYDLIMFNYTIDIKTILLTAITCMGISIICGIIAYYAVFDDAFFGDTDERANRIHKAVRKYGENFLYDALVIALICVTVFIPLIVIGLAENFVKDDRLNTMLTEMVFLGFAVLFIHLFWKNKKEPVEKVGKKYVILLLFGVVFAYVSYILAKTAGAVFKSEPIEEALVIAEGITPLNVVTSVFCYAVWGAVGEEFLFRGFLCRYFEKYGKIASVVISSLIFAAFHQGEGNKLIAFLIGIVLGFVYVRTKSLYLCVASHFLWNCMAYLNDNVARPENLILRNVNEVYTKADRLYYLVLIAMIFFGIWSIYLSFLCLDKKNKSERNTR